LNLLAPESENGLYQIYKFARVVPNKEEKWRVKPFVLLGFKRPLFYERDYEAVQRRKRKFLPSRE
jgi:hypothetical protein